MTAAAIASSVIAREYQLNRAWFLAASMVAQGNKGLSSRPHRRESKIHVAADGQIELAPARC